MNTSRPLLALANDIYRVGLESRLLLPRQRCRAMGRAEPGAASIDHILIINLDRTPDRLAATMRELAHVVDSSGAALSHRTTRIRAVDAAALGKCECANQDVVAHYTLRDQLAVEPQPRVLPDAFDLERPIRMSPSEVAVARSHIAAWRAIATGTSPYVLVLEDDVWFRASFGSALDRAWRELTSLNRFPLFDLLYLSYKEVTGGAPKVSVSTHVVRPLRGLWYLSGYVLSRDGARALLERLPCRGPVDLWMNLQFEALDVKALSRSVIEQRRDFTSTNDYSVLSSLSTMGVIDGASAALFSQHPEAVPVIACGAPASGLTSLAMALSMLGYTCCSDLDALPQVEERALLTHRGRRRFNAYVNIGTLEARTRDLRALYPHAKFIVTAPRAGTQYGLCDSDASVESALRLPAKESDKWRVLCEYLRCPPPLARYPELPDLGQRTLESVGAAHIRGTALRFDKSPWVVRGGGGWAGVHVRQSGAVFGSGGEMGCEDPLQGIASDRWYARNDTFPGNLALFRASHVAQRQGGGLLLRVACAQLGVREYAAAALSSRTEFHFGRFEVCLKAAGVSGLVTGFFLHRDSPRQEIDVEIRGHRPGHLLANVFFNPGEAGARFDYGYRGAPVEVALGFDASRSFHRYALEWSPTELRWLVDDRVVHRRGAWEPSPIPHLPMALHVNTWPTRSRELAGRLRRSTLPAQSELLSIRAEALLSCG